jgi:molybdopterin synthase catalytic subunit/molybdopterin converting factor small subunit
MVRYYAAARELTARESESIVLPAPEVSGRELLALVGALHPLLAPHLARLKLAVNDELAHGEPRVRAGDVVDVMPPVAGGAGADDAGRGARAVRTALRDRPLSIDEAYAAVVHPGAGGVAIFAGVVRDHAGGQPVVRLDYEAHRTLAEKELARVAEGVQREHPGSRVCAIHRVGSLSVGELAVVVAASAAHRAEAFDVCRALIERLKQTVPIWKHEFGPEGDAEWVNLVE